MEDRFLYRGQKVDTGKLYYGSLIQLNDKFYILVNETGDLDDIDFGYGFVEIKNPQQCTGLHDSTKWEQLTESEKKDFYNQVCSEDGETIKYQNIEDIKHLWKGTLIYEGDKFTPDEDYLDETRVVIWDDKTASFKVNCFGKAEQWNGLYDELQEYSEYLDLEDFTDDEIIGNIYEKSELLEVAE